MVDFSKEAVQQAAAQHSNGQQTMGQTPAPAPSQAAGAAAAAQAGAQQAAVAAGQAAQPLAKNPISVWDRLPENENYIKFTLENGYRQRVQFIDNEPHEKPSQYKKDKMDYEFQVVDMLTPEPAVKTWSISSVKLMNQLAAYLPIEDKIFDVLRVGEGLQIEYVLTPVLQ